MSEAGKRTLLLEGGGSSYGITGGTPSPAWLDGTGLSRVDVPGLYMSIFSGENELTCGDYVNVFGGCTIGGSSAINAGLFFQPPASDFDTYFPRGWKYADVKNAIGKLNARQPSSDITSTDGKRYLQSGYEAAKQWLVDGANFTELAINEHADNKTKVFGHPVWDYINGQRAGPTVTYLQKSLQRRNFALHTGVRVQRVLRRGDTATGVLATINGTANSTIHLAPGGRVILSGGALQSPQLLMLSGIGDADVLTNLSASGALDGALAPACWINNTAVGAGLFDNPNTFIDLASPAISSYTYSYASPPAADAALYLRNRSGPYTLASEVSVFWDYVPLDDGSRAGMQGTIGTVGFGAHTANGTVVLNVYGTSGLKSRGRVLLDARHVAGPSADVYYSNPQDAAAIATFIHGVFAALPAALTPLNIPRNASHADIVAYITTPSMYARGMVNHWSSSCRLGECVDTNTTVVGMRNLHVVDGSIVPPLTVNPQMGIMIAAERAAELILRLPRLTSLG